MDNEDKSYTVGGYTFINEQEAVDAKAELNAIKYLSKKTDANNPYQVYKLYNKILDKKLFSTSVGLGYLKELQQFLYVSKDIPNDKIKPIPVSSTITNAISSKREAANSKGTIIRLKKLADRNRDLFIKSLILNIVLIICIIVMVIITLQSDNPNIIDYENKIQDKYATWQEELQSREAVIKEKENALNIGK